MPDTHTEPAVQAAAPANIEPPKTPAPFGTPRRSFLSRLSWPMRKGVSRDARSMCCLVAVMVLVDKALPVDGLITEIGSKSVIFRPASTYILDRTGAEVTVRFGDQDIRGSIAAVTSSGYDIRFATVLSGADVAEFLQQFGQTGPSDRRRAARPA